MARACRSSNDGSRGGHDEVRHAAQMDCVRSLPHRPVRDNCCAASPAQAYSGSRTRLNALAINNATRSRKRGRDCRVRWSSPDSRRRRSTTHNLSLLCSWWRMVWNRNRRDSHSRRSSRQGRNRSGCGACPVDHPANCAAICPLVDACNAQGCSRSSYSGVSTVKRWRHILLRPLKREGRSGQ